MSVWVGCSSGWLGGYSSSSSVVFQVGWMSCLRVWLGGLPVGLVDSIGLLVELGVELNMGGVLTLVECSTWVNMGSVFCSTWVKLF